METKQAIGEPETVENSEFEVQCSQKWVNFTYNAGNEDITSLEGLFKAASDWMRAEDVG